MNVDNLIISYILILCAGINALALFKHFTLQLFSYVQTSVLDDDEKWCSFTSIFISNQIISKKRTDWCREEGEGVGQNLKKG